MGIPYMTDVKNATHRAVTIEIIQRHLDSSVRKYFWQWRDFGKTCALSKGDQLITVICSRQPHSLRRHAKGPKAETLSKCKWQLDMD